MNIFQDQVDFVTAVNQNILWRHELAAPSLVKLHAAICREELWEKLRTRGVELRLLPAGEQSQKNGAKFETFSCNVTRNKLGVDQIQSRLRSLMCL